MTPHTPPAETSRRETAAVWRMRVLWWCAILLAFGVLLWLLGPILTPFAVGAAVGYFLDPLVSRLAARGVPRALAAAGMVTAMMGALVLGLLVLVPLLAGEAATLAGSLPGLFDDARDTLTRRFPALDLGNETSAARELLARIGEQVAEAGPALFGGVVSGVGGLVRAVLFWVVMPVVAFYLLMDWQRLLRAVDDLLPRANLDTIRRLAGDIDAALAGYVRGVVIVCTILAAYYAAALTLAGLTYGVLVGVIAGAISFIPYVGAFIGGVLAIGLALYQFWDAPLVIAAVVAIFLLGQFLESQVLVPRLVGSSVNLHPVWLIFAVMAFGYLFGFVGAVVAVPLAAALGVLVRFAVAEYRASRLYDEPQAETSSSTAAAKEEG